MPRPERRVVDSLSMLLPTTKDQEPSVRDPDLPNFNRSGDAHDEVSRAMAAGGRDKCAMDGARPSQDMDVLPREKRPTGRGDSPEPARPAWRSEARRVGKECGSTCRSRWSRYP